LKRHREIEDIFSSGSPKSGAREGEDKDSMKVDGNNGNNNEGGEKGGDHSDSDDEGNHRRSKKSSHGSAAPGFNRNVTYTKLNRNRISARSGLEVFLLRINDKKINRHLWATLGARAISR